MKFAASLLAALLSLAASAWAQEQAFTNRSTELKDKGAAEGRTLATLPDCADLPVVVMSALPEDEARQGGLDGVEYLRKPFEVDALLAILSRLHPQRPT